MTSLPILNQPMNDTTRPGALLHTAPLNIVPFNAMLQTEAPQRRLPRWLKRPLPQSGMAYTSDVISDLRLETVCESARCPNRTECWSQKTATFMIGGQRLHAPLWILLRAEGQNRTPGT